MPPRVKIHAKDQQPEKVGTFRTNKTKGQKLPKIIYLYLELRVQYEVRKCVHIEVNTSIQVYGRIFVFSCQSYHKIFNTQHKGLIFVSEHF